MSKLYNLGCSFARGNIADKCNHLCETNLGPGKLIADYLNLEEVNLARNGNSLDGILKDLYFRDFDNNSLVLIGIPPKVRFYVPTYEKRKLNKLKTGKSKNYFLKNPFSKNLKVLNANSENSIDIQKQIENTMEFAFSKGPLDTIDNYFYSERWDTIFHKSTKVKLDDLLNYRFLMDLFSVQIRLKELNLKYIIYNNMADMNFTSNNLEINTIMNKIDFEYYYRPNFKMIDLTKNGKNLEFCVANGDSHPNHLCYKFWFEEIKKWINEKETFYKFNC